MAAWKGTPAQRAALRKAQLASAKKRKRRALGRNLGRGAVGSKRGSRRMRYRVMRAAGGLATAAAVAGAATYVRRNYQGSVNVHAGRKGYRTHRFHARLNGDYKYAQGAVAYRGAGIGGAMTWRKRKR